MSDQNYQQKELQALRALRAAIKSRDQGISLAPKKTTHILRQRKKKKLLDLKKFNRIIKVDPEKLEAEIEGCASFYNIVSETLKYGLIPEVVPEFSGITVGGTVSGLGLESSSFKYGIVQETLKSASVLTGQGEIVECSSEKNSDLFNALPNSFGSLGYVLKCTMRLIPAKKYVKIEIIKHKNPEDYFKQLKSEVENNNNDFVDGAIFAPDNCVIVLGKMVDALPAGHKPLNLIKNIYFEVLKYSPDKTIEYLKIFDYLFRWDVDAFWGMESYPILKIFLHNKLLRTTLLRPFLQTDKLLAVKAYRDKLVGMLDKIKPSSQKFEELIQDFGIDIDKSAEFVNWYDQALSIYPLWVCPLKKMVRSGTYPLFDFRADVIIDFGFYALTKIDKAADDDHYLKIGESKVQEMEGMKGLYSKNTYSEEEFWKIYDKEAYFNVKKKYDPESVFPNVYKKISVG